MLVLFGFSHIVYKEFLLSHGERFPFFYLMTMSDFQFFKHPIGRVPANVVIIHRNLKHLMKHIMDIVNECSLLIFESSF